MIDVILDFITKWYELNKDIPKEINISKSDFERLTYENNLTGSSGFGQYYLTVRTEFGEVKIKGINK